MGSGGNSSQGPDSRQRAVTIPFHESKERGFQLDAHGGVMCFGARSVALARLAVSSTAAIPSPVSAPSSPVPPPSPASSTPTIAPTAFSLSVFDAEDGCVAVQLVQTVLGDSHLRDGRLPAKKKMGIKKGEEDSYVCYSNIFTVYKEKTKTQTHTQRRQHTSGCLEEKKTLHL